MKPKIPTSIFSEDGIKVRIHKVKTFSISYRINSTKVLMWTNFMINLLPMKSAHTYRVLGQNTEILQVCSGTTIAVVLRSIKCALRTTISFTTWTQPWVSAAWPADSALPGRLWQLRQWWPLQNVYVCSEVCCVVWYVRLCDNITSLLAGLQKIKSCYS